MTGDRTKADAGSSKVPPGSATPNRPPASDKADGRDDEVSKRSIADLARRLAERAAQQRAVNPSAAEAERRAALEAYDQARERRLIVGLSVAVAVTVGASIAYLVSTVELAACPAVAKRRGTAGARVVPRDDERCTGSRFT